jgi:hypothetical protein
MKIIVLSTLLCLALQSKAQVDTVIIKPSPEFVSHFSKRLNYDRVNVKYHMEERGNIRDVFVYLSVLEELANGKKMYAVRIDARANRNIFTDAPLSAAEYIDADELPKVIGYLQEIIRTMKTSQDAARFTEYRYFTRGGIMLECYTGVNRWRFCLNYKTGSFGVSNLLAFDKADNLTYINRIDDVQELLATLENIQREIQQMR